MSKKRDSTSSTPKTTASGKVRRVIQVAPDVAAWLEEMGGLSAAVTFLVRERQRAERDTK